MKIYKLQEIGYWSNSYENGVTPTFLCGEYELTLKTKLLDYMNSCPYNGIELGYARCRFECPYSFTSYMGAGVKTDGVWSWPEGLVHYIECHDLLLPEEFIAHARSLNFSPLKVDQDLIDNLCLNVNPNVKIDSQRSIWEKWLEIKGEKEYLKSSIVSPPCEPKNMVESDVSDENDWWAKL